MKRTLTVVCAAVCTAALTSCEVGGLFGAFLNDDKEDSSISVLYTSGDDASYGSEEEEGEPVYYIDEDGDIEWAENSAPDFNVSTAGQLAGVVYYVNNIYTYSPDTQLTINIYNDIDLSNWVWEPMGRIDKDGTDRRFNGSIIGNGHTISNMSIKYYSGDCYGLVGRAESFSTKNVIITDAEINAPSGLAGMYCGKVDGTGDCEGLDCTGKITTGASVLSGAFFGAAPKINIISAGSYVELNGERAVFGSREDYILQNPDDERFFRIDLDNDTKCINVEHSPEFKAPRGYYAMKEMRNSARTSYRANRSVSAVSLFPREAVIRSISRQKLKASAFPAAMYAPSITKEIKSIPFPSTRMKGKG